MAYIYKIENQINHKIYIGKTNYTNPQKRWKQHQADSKKDSCNHRALYRALNKYGIKNFSLSLIEEVDNDYLNEREKFWISEYRSYIGFKDCKGYNATLGGDSKLTKDYEAIAKNYLLTKSKAQTAKEMGCCIETVNRALESNHIITISKCAGKTISRIDDNNNEIIYPSIRQAAEEIAKELNKNFQTVRKRINYVLLHCPNQKAYGYFWKENL